jgi:hypothetical protein
VGHSHRHSVVGSSEEGWFGMVKTKYKLLFLREGGPSFIPSGFAIAAYMTCSGRNLLPCSCYWDGF